MRTMCIPVWWQRFSQWSTKNTQTVIWPSRKNKRNIKSTVMYIFFCCKNKASHTNWKMWTPQTSHSAHIHTRPKRKWLSTKTWLQGNNFIKPSQKNTGVKRYYLKQTSPSSKIKLSCVTPSVWWPGLVQDRWQQASDWTKETINAT